MSGQGRDAQVSFEPLGRRVSVDSGTPLDEAARIAGVPLAQACRGAGICGRCAVLVHGPASGLTAMAEREQDTINRQGIGPDHRLACCTKVRGDVRVSTAYW